MTKNEVNDISDYIVSVWSQDSLVGHVIDEAGHAFDEDEVRDHLAQNLVKHQGVAQLVS